MGLIEMEADFLKHRLRVGAENRMLSAVDKRLVQLRRIGHVEIAHDHERARRPVAAAQVRMAGALVEFAGRTNVKIIEGNIDTNFPRFLSSSGKADFVFIDANHRYEPTLRYFQMVVPRTHTQSLVLIDDIHCSPEMERAWTELKKYPTVYGSADLYKVGILFFDPSLNKQDVVLQF